MRNLDDLTDFYNTLNSLTFRNELNEMFGFPQMEKINSEDGINTFIENLENSIKNKNFSKARLQHEFSLVDMLLKRADTRYDRLNLKTSIILGFASTLLTIILTTFTLFSARIGFGKITFLLDLLSIFFIIWSLITLRNNINPKPGFEFHNLFLGMNEEKDVEEETLFYNEIASYWIAKGIRDYQNHKEALDIRKSIILISCALATLLISLILNNIEFFHKIFNCLYCCFV